MSPEITLHEHTSEDGALIRTRLSCLEGRLVLLTPSEASAGGTEALPLPEGAVEAVMRRFGKPLEEGETPPLVEALDLGEGCSLGRFRFLRMFDVIARDYLVLHVPGEEPLCEMATAVTAALHHLGRRLAASAVTSTEG